MDYLVGAGGEGAYVHVFVKSRYHCTDITYIFRTNVRLAEVEDFLIGGVSRYVACTSGLSILLTICLSFL